MRKFWTLLAMTTGGLNPATASAEPLQPTGKWELEYSDRACTAKRSYGDYTLAFRPSPLGMTTRYVVEGPGKAERSRQYSSTIEFRDGGSPIAASSLVYPLKQKGRRGIVTILQTAEAERVEKSGRFQISSELKSRKRGGKLAMSGDRLAIEFSIGSTPVLRKTLDDCMRDLRNHWGMVDGKLPEPVNVAEPKSPLRGLLTSNDYPSDAMVADQIGATQALLLIDEQGRVVDCVTIKSSGVASIDAVVCQVMEERARLTPARDANGRPVKSTTLTPTIQFVIAN